MRRRIIAAVATLATAALTPLALPAPATAAPARYADDFNGDGHRDLAVGMPSKTVDGKKRAGAILVTFGSASGLTGKRVYVTQDSPGVPGAAETEDLFGTDLSSGDLDGDGYADLLVTSEAETVDGLWARGSVTVLWGGPTPFRGGASLADPAPAGQQWFGTDTAVGDFVGDAAPEVVVSDASGLWLVEGGFSRTSLPQPEPLYARGGNNQVGFGQLAVGDFSGGGKDELAVTVPGTTVVYGSGPTGEESEFHDRAALPGGTTSAAGDLNGDGRDDLAVGLPRPDLDSNGIADPSSEAGYVMVFQGVAEADATGGLSRTRRTYHQGTSGIPGENEPLDQFGADLSIADVTGDGRAELAVGVSYESLGGHTRTGDVLVLRGSATGPTATGAERFSQSTAGVPGAAEFNDEFGACVRLADFDRDGKADLATTAPGENRMSGAVWQLRGTGSGLSTSGADVFSPADYGLAAGSHLGEAVND
ncbi:FG-GAP repeat protein [Streptomyces sp. NPDC050844]|uniref:FG-GAP repeat protein n=1 Tax=Streptomyces sp. NPDC050844 TaxID=3155790 RepID=UPI0033D4B9B2